MHRPTCLQPVLAGGSTINSSLQLLPNKSLARIPVKLCRAAPWPSLADSESPRAAEQLLERQTSQSGLKTLDLFLSLVAIQLHSFQGVFCSQVGLLENPN